MNNAMDVTPSLQKAATYIQGQVRDDGHWCAEAKSNPTLTSEYITLLYALDLPLPDGPEPWISWLLSEQNQDGSWGLAPEIRGEISVSVESYFALKMLGVSPAHPAMEKAREWILAEGGVARVRIFSRIFLAIFGLFPWSAVPELPPELLFVPTSARFSVYYMASWARSTVVTLLLVSHHRPIFGLPNGRREPNNPYLDEIWCESGNKDVPYSTGLLQAAWQLDSTAIICTAVDNTLHALGGMRKFPLRTAARRQCVEWLLEHQEEDGGWFGIFPPMHGGALALFLEGYSPTEPNGPLRRALDALESFIWTDEKGKRMQPCVSPVWDTILTTIGLLDAGLPGDNEYVVRSMAWLQARQDLDEGPKAPGDWRLLCPDVTPGGFSFEYFNRWSPDIDDTAAAILAFVKQDHHSVNSEPVIRAIQWILGMQNADGGWGAFDRENNKLFFNRIPFSDMDSMCDPSTADVTARVVEAFGLVLQHTNEKSVLSYDIQSAMKHSATRAIDYLLKEQEANGSWFGRWGANYIYGTGNTLCAFANTSSIIDSTKKRSFLIQESMKAGTDWLITAQNTDGGWGECLESYIRPRLAGQGKSTASQTGWALMALLTLLPASHLAIKRGVQYLLSTQAADGKWSESVYTGVGFPNHFYLGYVYYPHYFAMMALGRYASLTGCRALRDAS